MLLEVLLSQKLPSDLKRDSPPMISKALYICNFIKNYAIGTTQFEKLTKSRLTDVK